MNQDTEFYNRARVAWMKDHPYKKRESDLTMSDRSEILRDAQTLKEQAKKLVTK